MKKITLFLFMLLGASFSALQAQITTFPYTEDFESGDGGWVADNTTNGTWALGTPAGAVINSAASGTNSWATNLTGTYNTNENSWVTSPVFDLSSLTSPAIQANIWIDSENSWDGTVLQSSIDGGTTWVNVGADGDPNNWFNDDSINGNPGGQQEGWTGTGGSGTQGWVVARHILTGLAGESNVILRFAFGSDGSVVDDGFAFDDIEIFEVACAEPTDVTVANITSDGAEFSWTENGTATSWNVEIVPAGDTPTGTPTATGVSNPYTVTGLTAVTAYDFYVVSDCGTDLSAQAGPVNFETLCAVFTPDYIQDFETIIPDCWDEANAGDATTGPSEFGAGSWTNDGFLNNGFTGAYKINLWVANKSDWILSPLFDLTGGPFQVEFDFGVMNFGSSTTPGTLGSDDIVQLLITTDNGTTWTPLLTYDNNSTFTATGEHPVITLEAYAGQTVQFGILGSEGTVDDPQDIDVFVDNFRVRAIPTCPEPTDLTATNVNLTDTEVGWTENGTSTVWNIEYGEEGFTPGTGTVVTGVTTNPYTLTGLTPDTDYEFYVQAQCDPTNLSSYNGPGAFHTGYCLSEPSSNDGDGVNNVTIGVTDFPSLGDVTYENQTATVVNLFPGVSTNVIIEFAHSFTYNTNIWIDFNDNITFEDSELVYQGNSSGNGNPHILDATFVMPTTATLGQHRMRIGSADNGQATPNPCYNGSWGVTLDFTIDIQDLTCTLPEASFSVNEDCDNDQYYIQVDVTSLGDATSLELSNDVDANTLQATATGVYQVGPFAFGTTAKAFVTNEQDNNCTISSQFFNILACPPSNDECINATIATVNADEDCTEVNAGTLLAANPSSVANGSCTGNPDDDVWYEFVALGEQQIIQILNIQDGTTNIDHALYEGDCNNLTEVYCSNETQSLTPSLVIGNTYYLRIFSGGDNPATSTFDLCISTLGEATFCLEALPICADPNIQYESIVSEDEAPFYIDYDCLGQQPDPQWNTINFDIAGDYEFSLDQVDLSGNPIDIDFIVWGPFVDQDGGCVDLLPENIADCSYSATASETITLNNVPENSVYVILITNFSQLPGLYTFTQDSGPVDGTNCDVVCDVTLQYQGVDVEDDVEDLITPDEVFDICGSDTIELTADTFYGVDQYIWYVNGVAVENYNESTYVATETGTYQVQVLGGICDNPNNFSALIEINMYNEAPAVDDQMINLCQTENPLGVAFDLDALTTDLALGDEFTVTYYTSLADAESLTDPVSSPYNTTTDETLVIRIEDTNAFNNNYTSCRSFAEVALVLEDCIFPQGISPNNDNMNDTFDLTRFDVVKLEIFNRNGTSVYSKSNYTNEWEGQTDDGEELPVGTYFYTVKYDGGLKEKTGWVYINR